jgi:mannosyltransferase
VTNLNERTQHWLIPVAILLLAFSLRLSTITSKSLWVDEVVSLQQAQQTTDWITANPGLDPHPPGYYLFLHEWIQRFGTSELWLRLPSAIFGALSVLIVYWLGFALHSPRLGRWAAFLSAIDPIAIWYAQETRMYAMLTFFAVCGTLLMILMLKRRSVLAWPLTVLSFSLALYFDYTGLLYWVISIVAMVVAVSWLKAWTLSRFALWLSAEAAIAFLYLPQWPKMVETISSVAQGHTYVFDLITAGLQRYGLQIDQQSAPIWLIVIGAVLGSIVLLFALRFLRRRISAGHLSDRSHRVITLAILVAYSSWLIVAAAPRFYVIKRVLMIYSPLVAVAAAYALTSIRRRSIVYAAVSATAIAALLNWIVWPKEDWRSAASLIAQQSQPADVIVGAPGYVTIPFDYYYAQLNGNAHIVSISGLKEYANQRLWLIIGSTHEVGLNDPVPGQLTSSRKTIGHWQLYEVEILLLH